MAFVYPTTADYTGAISAAAYDLQPYVGVPLGDGGILSPPMMTQVRALTATLEQSSGLSITELGSLANNIAGLVQATSPLAVVTAVEAVLNNVESVIDSVGMAMDIASDAMAVVPIVGQIAGFVLGILKAIFGSAAAWQQYKDECRRDLRKKVNDFCKDLTEKSEVKPTSINPITGAVVPGPGDWFRDLAKVRQAGSGKFPPNVSSLVLMLCGGATSGFGMGEERYQMIVEFHRKGLPLPWEGTPMKASYPARPVGIPLPTRIRMWGLIKAIMASTQNPDTKHVNFIADNGRAAMPVLLDIINNEYWALKEGQGHGIDDAFVRSLATEALRWTRRTEECCVMFGDAKFKCEPVVDAGCGDLERGIVDNMVKQFESMRYDYNFRLYNAFVDPKTGLWQTGFAGGSRGVALSMGAARKNYYAAEAAQRQRFLKGLGWACAGAAGGYALTRYFQAS